MVGWCDAWEEMFAASGCMRLRVMLDVIVDTAVGLQCVGHVGHRGAGGDQCGDACDDRECGLDGVETRGFVMCGGMRWGSGWCGRRG